MENDIVRERSRLINAAAEVLESEAEDLARMMAIEMGKPLRDGRGEVLKSARGCRYYAENGEGFLRDEPVIVENAAACVRYEPLVRCCRSCPGISRSGRFSASPRPRSWVLT